MTNESNHLKGTLHLQSAQNRLLVKNGQVVNDDGISRADVYIENSHIKEIGINLIIPGGTRVIDAAGKYIIPGGIDANTHLQQPVNTEGTSCPNGTQTIDDFYSGTKAALTGGTTTIVDCIVPKKGQSLLEAYDTWRGWAEDKVCCDFALRMAIPSLSQEILDQMEEVAKPEYGINTFYVTMEGENMINDQDLLKFFDHCAKLGCLGQVHAESGEMVNRNIKALLDKGIKGPEGFALAHVEEAEEEATLRALVLANQAHCPVYLTGLSCSTAADIVAKKKSRGYVAFAEVTPAHLALDEQEYWEPSWIHAASHLCKPPLRRNQREALVAATAENLDVVASHHATFNSRQKALGLDDFTKIPVGVNGIGERLSIVWDKTVHAGLCSPERFVALTSSNAAKILNMYPQKGKIAVGSHADLVVWNPDAFLDVTKDGDCLKTDLNIYDGMAFHGAPDVVIVQGKVVAENGDVRVSQGSGNFIHLLPFAPEAFEKLGERKEVEFMVRKDLPSITDSEDIPAPTAPKPKQPVKAASQHKSSFDLRSHPNPPECNITISPQRVSIRVKAPPGGKTTGFW